MAKPGKKPSVFLIGAGRAGKALAAVLKARGCPMLGVYDIDAAAGTALEEKRGIPFFRRLEDSPVGAASVVFVAVKDDSVHETGKRLAEIGNSPVEQIVAHLSGSQPPWALGEGGVFHCALFHPLVSFADEKTAEKRLKTGFIAVAGDDYSTKRLIKIIRLIGSTALKIDERKLAAYHAAASVAGNFPAALFLTASRLFEEAGISKRHSAKATLNLILSCVENMRSKGFPEGLTGPIKRKDIMTVRKHILALKRLEEEQNKLYVPLYRALSVHLLEELLELGEMDRKNYLLFRRLLKTSGDID